MSVFRVHRPWFIGVVKVYITLGVLLSIHWFLTGAMPTWSWPAVLGPCFYEHLFKYWWHRYPMHQTFRYLESVRHSHSIHHRSFNKNHFKSRDPELLNDIVSDVHIFPLLLTIHYIVAMTGVLALRAVGLGIEWGAVATAFVALSVWFAFFEATHWFTHVDGNIVDRALCRIPFAGFIWLHMVEVHREHHTHPDADFNFLFPYLGDRLGGTYRPPRIKWDWKARRYLRLP